MQGEPFARLGHFAKRKFLRRIDGDLGVAHGIGEAFRQLVDIGLHGFIELVIGCNGVDRPPLQRQFGANGLAAQQYLSRALVAHRLRPPLRGPEAADAANHGPDLLQLGVGRHHSNIRGEMKGVGAADAVAVDAMDDRLRAVDHLGEGFFQRAFVGAHSDHVVAVPCPVVADIAAGRKETTAGGCKNDRADIRRIADAFQGIDDLVQRLAPEGIAAVGAVDGDPGSKAAPLQFDVLITNVENGFTHGFLPVCRMRARAPIHEVPI